MAARNEPRRFAGEGGAVSGTVALPEGRRPQATVVLAHGAGAPMNAPLLVDLAGRLAERGIAVVRFNFPYAERGARVPDRAPVLEACYRAVLAAVRADPQLGGGTRLVIGGKSMGGRMASHLAAAGEPVDGLVFLGYPLHPAGRPTQLRAAHLPRIAAPMLYVTGTRDALCELELLREVLRDLPRATLHVVEDGDHSFHVRKRTGRGRAETVEEIAAATSDWLRATAHLP
ncbi:MAG: alpha/beta family hydrolase [Candidatus Binatia bacterium]